MVLYPFKGLDCCSGKHSLGGVGDVSRVDWSVTISVKHMMPGLGTLHSEELNGR